MLRDVILPRLRSFEQPIAAEDIEGLAQLVARTQLGVMADEGLNNRASLRRLVQAKGCTAVNVSSSATVAGGRRFPKAPGWE